MQSGKNNGGKRSSIIVRAAALAAVGLGASSAQAQIYWDGSGPDQNWLTTQNWESSLGGDVQPGFADTAILNNGGTIVINSTGPVAGAFRIGLAADTTISPHNLGLGGTVNFNDGSLITGSNIPTIDIGVDPLAAGGAAVWNHNGGTVTTGELFRLGVAAGSLGTLNMNGGLIDISTGDTAGLDFMALGDNGEGIINMTGGEIRSRTQFFVALQNTSKGTINISGGLIDAFGNMEMAARGNATLGTGAVAEVNQTGGTIKTRGIFALGWDRFATATVTSSAGAIIAREINVGRSGDGTMNLSGNVTVDSDSMTTIAVFASGGPSNGILNVSGNATLTTGGMFVAEQGNGTLNLNGGAIRVLGATRNGATFPGAPTPTSPSRFANLIVGQDGGGPIRVGNGVVNQTAGTMTVDTNVFLGDFDDSNGVYNISGGTLSVVGNFSIGAPLASNAPADDVRTGTQGQALGAKGTLIVSGSTSAITIGGDFLANPGDKTRTGTANAATLGFNLDNGGITQILVAGDADLDGAVIDMGFVAGSTIVPDFNQAFNLVTALQFGATGTGTTQASGSGEGFTVAAADAADWLIRVVTGGNGEILQAVNRYLPGDTNNDKIVNFADLVALAQNYNKTGTARSTGDFNRDTTTNFADLVTLARNYNSNVNGQFGLPEGVSAQFASDWALAQSLVVPEPTTLGLLAGASTLLVGRRRKAK